MLKITKKFEYGLQAIRFIAKQDSVCSAKEISQSTKLPYEMVAKLLQELAKEEIIISVQGTKGGYQLNRTTSEISFTDIATALNEKINVVDCSGDHEKKCQTFSQCSIKDPMIIIQTKIKKIFDNTTVAEIV